MTRYDIRRPENPHLVVLASLAQFLLRWRCVILVPIALVYLGTLTILVNRQNLDMTNQAKSYDQKRKYKEARISRSECTFCEGEKGIPNLDLAVPQAGGNTCRSILVMAASEMKGSAKCATLQKEERVCCPRPYSPTKTIFVISLQGTPGAHESNQGRLDLFKEKWRMACGSSSDSTNIEHCPAVFDKRRGYGVTLAWILCLWRAMQLDEEVAIFLEDDARLFENSTQEFCDVDKRGELLSKLPSDTFVAWLGGHTWSYEDSAVPYRRVRNSYGAYGFLVPRNSIDDFYAALKHGLIHGSKDRNQNVHHNSLDPEPNFYRAAREHHKKIYAFNPLVVWHEGGYSNTWGKVRGNITGLETGRHGIKVGSGMTNTKDRKKSVSAGHQRAVQQIDSQRLSPQSSSAPVRATTQCTFCEGETVIPSLDLVVPKTGGNTCRSIKKMADGEMNGSTICATLKKEERVCCPVVHEKSPSLVEPFSSQDYKQSKLIVPFKKGDHVVYEKRNELRLAQIVDVVHEKNKITLKYFKPYSSTGLEETVEYRKGLLHDHSEALRFRTGTFANCISDYAENNTLVFTEANDQSANVSCKRIRFAAEAGSFVRKSGDIIVGVLSTSDNFRWRDVIRSTWAAESTVFFVIAGSWDDIEEEYHRYKDIIWIDMEDSFRLITYKTSMFFQVVNMMSSELNLTYSHALKTDDDSYVAMGRLEQLVKEEQTTSIHYWGYSDMKYVKPLRNLKSRYYVSLDQYPEPYYPPFVTGAAILLSHKTVECVTEAMQYARFLAMEDVFLGIMTARCGVIPTHSEFVRVYRGSVGLSRWTTTENKTLQVTMKGKIIQHRILNPEEMIAHHESIKASMANTIARKRPVDLGHYWNGLTLQVTRKGKTIQNRILNPEERIAHHETIKTSKHVVYEKSPSLVEPFSSQDYKQSKKQMVKRANNSTQSNDISG